MNGQAVFDSVFDRVGNIRGVAGTNNAHGADFMDTRVRRVHLQEQVIASNLPIEEAVQVSRDSRTFLIH
jgi:hypothetical protein